MFKKKMKKILNDIYFQKLNLINNKNNYFIFLKRSKIKALRAIEIKFMRQELSHESHFK